MSVRYAGSGHLLGSGARGITAAAFRPGSSGGVRAAATVLDDVFSSPNLNHSWFATSDTGTLAYVPGDPALCRMAWVDRSGNMTPILDKTMSVSDPGFRRTDRAWRWRMGSRSGWGSSAVEPEPG